MSSPVSADPPNPYLRSQSLPELLSWCDVDFVRTAFVTVLGRQPDPDGEAFYTSLIRRGRSKKEVLWRLRRSAEGRAHDPGISGFDRALNRARWGRLPLLGRWMVPEESNGVARREHRIMQNEMQALRVQGDFVRREQHQFHHALMHELTRWRISLVAQAQPASHSASSADTTADDRRAEKPVRHSPPELSNEAKRIYHAIDRSNGVALINEVVGQ